MFLNKLIQKIDNYFDRKAGIQNDDQDIDVNIDIDSKVKECPFCKCQTFYMLATLNGYEECKEHNMVNVSIGLQYRCAYCGEVYFL